MGNPVKVVDISTKTTSNIANHINDNVNNNIQKINNNVINVNNVGKYALDRSKFTPNTEESMLAVEVATRLNDLQNYACYRKAIQDKSIGNVMRCLKSVLSDIKEKKDSKTPVRYPARYFMWKLKKNLF